MIDMTFFHAEYDNSRVGEEESFSFSYVWAALKDWQVRPILVDHPSSERLTAI